MRRAPDSLTEVLITPNPFCATFPNLRRSCLAIFRYGAALSSILLSCACSSDTPGGDADAGTGTETGGRGGATSGGGRGGSGAAGGSGGMAGAGGAAAGAGGRGTTGGSGGSVDAGGAAGFSRDGQAGASGSGRDASTDAADTRDDATSNPDRDADRGLDAVSDRSDDAPFDTSAPPLDAGACLPLPATGVYATFRVVNDVFRASITNPSGIDQALALWRGQSQAKIPTGQLECGNGTYNCGWTWRMAPDSVTFAEITIEVCDATPSYVQGNCASFPNGFYCPWSAELIELRDCRTQTTCPAVPR